jgi:saccharopine dehydrogenase-like NADP-dependent oxidoreductase
MRGYDVVIDGTTIALNGVSTACIAEAGCHGINLNGFGEEEASDEAFRQADRSCVPGFGMTPGTTQMMVMQAAALLDSVEVVRVSHGAFRPIAFRASITETTTYEYDPLLSSRVVYEDEQLRQVPPFARPRDIALPRPYGTLDRGSFGREAAQAHPVAHLSAFRRFRPRVGRTPRLYPERRHSPEHRRSAARAR